MKDIDTVKEDRHEKLMWIITIGLFTFVLGGFLTMAFDMDITQEKTKEECTNQGMTYYYSDGKEYCIDDSNNAHRVFIECEGFLQNVKCNHRFINILEDFIIIEKEKNIIEDNKRQ